MNPPVQWHQLGRVEYADGLEMQQQLQQARRDNLIPDTLLLLEHQPVLTMGRAAKATNIIAPAQHLESLGVEIFETDRGGDVTYHGPGQITGYPLLFLEEGRQDVRRYVRAIEELMIRTVADYGITATRFEQWPGVWVAESRRGGPRKIAALGVHLSRWYTKHGFALNVSTNLSHFELIVPCGIREAGVTSMREELGREVSQREVEERIAQHFREVFECELTRAPEPARTISVVVRRDDGRVLLLKRTEARGGFWQSVTGHVETGESPAQAAQRELREETGVTSEVRSLGYEHAFCAPHPMAEGVAPRLMRETAFVARSNAPAEFDRHEHSDAAWFSVAEAISLVPFAGLKRAIQLSATA